MIGKTLGHYRIHEEIGAGGMGVVYRARDQRLDRDVALKVLPAGTLADEPSRKRFRREALALRRYVSPYVIATVHAALGQRARALDWLEQAYAERPAPNLAFLKVERDVDPLRSEPRFVDLLRRVGFPD